MTVESLFVCRSVEVCKIAGIVRDISVICCHKTEFATNYRSVCRNACDKRFRTIGGRAVGVGKFACRNFDVLVGVHIDGCAVGANEQVAVKRHKVVDCQQVYDRTELRQRSVIHLVEDCV